MGFQVQGGSQLPPGVLRVCVCERGREREEREAERERGKEERKKEILPFLPYSGYFCGDKGTSNITNCGRKDNDCLVLSMSHFASLEPRLL